MKTDFVIGYIVGVILTGVFVIVLSPNPQDFTIKSRKKIEPQILLTTDGTKVDTLYVYKQNNYDNI